MWTTASIGVVMWRSTLSVPAARNDSRSVLSFRSYVWFIVGFLWRDGHDDLGRLAVLEQFETLPIAVDRQHVRDDGAEVDPPRDDQRLGLVPRLEHPAAVDAEH